MYLKRGTRARFNFTDGTCIEGTVQFSWSWNSWKVTETDLLSREGSVRAEGYQILAKRHIAMVQVMTP